MTREEILADFPSLSEKMVERMLEPYSLEEAQADIARQVSESYHKETKRIDTEISNKDCLVNTQK